MRVLTVGVLSTAALLLAAPASAQGTASGLFATRPSAATNTLTTQLSIAEKFYRDLPPEVGGLVPARNRQAGLSTLFVGSADYMRSHGGAELFGGASTYFNFLHDLDRVTSGTHVAHVGAALPLPARGTLRLVQSAAYSPSYLYGLFPTVPADAEEGIAANPDYRIETLESISYRTSLSAAYGSARKTRVTANADYRVSDFPDSARGRLETRKAGMRLSRALSQSSTLTLGYTYTGSHYVTTGDKEEHSAVIGITYAPALSVTRRVTFSLQIAPTVFTFPGIAPLDGSAAPPSESRFYPVQGEASVDYPFRPRWRATASYRRGINYVPFVSEPLLSDSGTVRLGGVLSRRVDVSASAGYLTTPSRSTTWPHQDLRTYTGEARIRYALRRDLAAYVEYLHYQYDFRARAQLAEGLPVTFAQRGIRVGLTFFSQAVG